jgi:1,6-anhydro-N-acetylmuramate kinase
MLYTVTRERKQKIFHDQKALVKYLMEEFAEAVAKRLKEKMCGEENIKDIYFQTSVALHREKKDGPIVSTIPIGRITEDAYGNEVVVTE